MSRARNPENEFTPNSQGTIAKLRVREQLIAPRSFVDGVTIVGTGAPGDPLVANVVANPADVSSVTGTVLAVAATDIIGPRTLQTAVGKNLLCRAVVNVNVRGAAALQPGMLVELYRFNGVTQVIADCRWQVANATNGGVPETDAVMVCEGLKAGDALVWDYYVRITVAPAPAAGCVYTISRASLVLQEF